MKKIAVGILFAACIVACNSAPEGYTINGTLRGEIENGTQVFLKTTDSLRSSMVEVDTALVENGLFTFSGKSDVPQLHYLLIDGIRGNSPIILENGEITFKAQKDSLPFAELRGTNQNDLFMGYLEESRRFASMSRTFNADFRKANTARDTAAVEALRIEYLELQEKAKSFELDFVRENPDALITALILEKIASMKSLPFKEVDSLYDALSPEVKASRPGQRMKKELDKSRATAIGTKAPAFSGPTPDGQSLALNEVKGKLTLVDFWAAWCKPCRMENPNIVSVYEKYKDKGFNVVGVSLDRKKEDWLGAIESDGLDWNHVSNLEYFRDPIAELYNVNAIPAAFLLDENGVIVAKDLRGSALEETVARLLN